MCEFDGVYHSSSLFPAKYRKQRICQCNVQSVLVLMKSIQQLMNNFLPHPQRPTSHPFPFTNDHFVKSIDLPSNSSLQMRLGMPLVVVGPSSTVITGSSTWWLFLFRGAVDERSHPIPIKETQNVNNLPMQGPLHLPSCRLYKDDVWSSPMSQLSSKSMLSVALWQFWYDSRLNCFLLWLILFFPSTSFIRAYVVHISLGSLCDVGHERPAAVATCRGWAWLW